MFVDMENCVVGVGLFGDEVELFVVFVVCVFVGIVFVFGEDYDVGFVVVIGWSDVVLGFGVGV